MKGKDKLLMDYPSLKEAVHTVDQIVIALVKFQGPMITEDIKQRNKESKFLTKDFGKGFVLKCFQ